MSKKSSSSGSFWGNLVVVLFILVFLYRIVEAAITLYKDLKYSWSFLVVMILLGSLFAFFTYSGIASPGYSAFCFFLILLYTVHNRRLNFKHNQSVAFRKEYIQSFKESDDYLLIAKYAQKNAHAPFRFSLDSHLSTLRQVISSNWLISNEEVYEFLSVEAELHLQNIFNDTVREEAPKLYNEYLEVAINKLGNQKGTLSARKMERLQNLLLADNIIPPSTSISLLENDLRKIKLLRKGARLREKLELQDQQMEIGSVDRMSSLDFEGFVVKLFEGKGYKKLSRKASDGPSPDVLLERLGEKVVVQVKQDGGPVSNEAIQEVVVAQRYFGVEKGIVVTNNYFTTSAQELAASNHVQLIDRRGLEIMLL